MNVSIDSYDTLTKLSASPNIAKHYRKATIDLGLQCKSYLTTGRHVVWPHLAVNASRATWCRILLDYDSLGRTRQGYHWARHDKRCQRRQTVVEFENQLPNLPGLRKFCDRCLLDSYPAHKAETLERGQSCLCKQVLCGRVVASEKALQLSPKFCASFLQSLQRPADFPSSKNPRYHSTTVRSLGSSMNVVGVYCDETRPRWRSLVASVWLSWSMEIECPLKSSLIYKIKSSRQRKNENLSEVFPIAKDNCTSSWRSISPLVRLCYRNYC